MHTLSPPPVTTTRVLLVEDNPGDVRLVREFLTVPRPYGALDTVFTVTHHARLSDALAWLGESSVDVVLLDLFLPDGRGLETLERLRSVTPSVPVVVLTGLEDEELATQALKAGAQDYLVKGQFDESSLMRALRYAIERERLLTQEQAARAQAEEAARKLEAIQRVTDAALAHLPLDDLLPELLTRVREVVGAETAAVLLSAADGSRLDVRVASGGEDEIGQPVRAEVNEAVAGRIVSSRQPVVLQSASGEGAEARGMRSLMGVPLLLAGQVLGVLQVTSLACRQFTQDDLRLLQLVADRAALAIDNAKLYQQMHREREQWRATVERMLDPVTVSDAEGHAIYMNPAYSQLIGMQIEPGVPVDEHAEHYRISHPDGTPVASQDLPLQRAALRNEEVREMELVHQSADERKVICVFNASPMHDAEGRVIGAVAVGRDVTQQRQFQAERQAMEDSLRQSEERLDLALQATELGTWDHDLLADRIILSDRAKAIYGLPPDAEVSPSSQFDLIHPEDRARMQELYLQTIDPSGDGRYDCQYRIIRADGTMRWVAARGEAHFAEVDGVRKAVRFVGTVLDITERKQVEEALQESRRILEALMEHLPEGITIVDAPETTVRMESRYGQELTGGHTCMLPVDSTDGGSGPWQLLHRDGQTPAAPEELPLIRATRNGEVIVNEEWVLRHADGHQVPILCNAGPIRDQAGHTIGGVIAWHDITPIKEARKALEEAYLREHYIAEVLQRALLPRESPVTQGYELATVYLPAISQQSIGGDFYDVFETADGKVGILIGDVSGKGVEAAALGAATRSTIRTLAYETSLPSESLARANSALYSQQASAGCFVTALLAVLDPETGRLLYSCAGHPPAVLSRSNGRGTEILTSHNLPLGVLPTQQYQDGEARLECGDKLVLYTDGIFEARRDTEEFGTEGIERVLRQNGCCNPADVSHRILEAATTWANGRLMDDAALVVLHRREAAGNPSDA